MEKDGHQSLLCWWRFYKETTQIWKVHQANGKQHFELQIILLNGG